LDVLDTAVEMGVEIAWQRRECDLVLLLRLIVSFRNWERIPEDAIDSKEFVDELVPILRIVLSLGTLHT
jgi:hypothetical protein